MHCMLDLLTSLPICLLWLDKYLPNNKTSFVPIYALVATFWIFPTDQHEGFAANYVASSYYVTSTPHYFLRLFSPECYFTGVLLSDNRQTLSNRLSMISQIQGSILCVLIFSIYCAHGYRDDLPMQKWSPDYFSYRFFPEDIQTYKRRMPSSVPTYYSSYLPNADRGSSQPSWHVGDMGTMYKRVSKGALSS